MLLSTLLIFSANAEVTCSSVEDCRDVTEMVQEQLEQHEEAEKIEAAIMRDTRIVNSNRVPYMRPFAKDENGNLLMMTYTEASNYCASRGLRLPSAFEFMLVSKLSGAEVSFLDKNQEGYSDTGRFYNPFGYEVPGWSSMSMTFAKKGTAKPTDFYYHIPTDFTQRISAYHGANFWSSTLASQDELYVYNGDNGYVSGEEYSLVGRSVPAYNQDGSVKRRENGYIKYRVEMYLKKYAVVCSRPRD